MPVQAEELLATLFTNSKACYELTGYEPAVLLVHLLKDDFSDAIVKLVTPLLSMMELERPSLSVTKFIKKYTIPYRDVHD